MQKLPIFYICLVIFITLLLQVQSYVLFAMNEALPQTKETDLNNYRITDNNYRQQASYTETACPGGITVLPISFHIFHEGGTIGNGHNWTQAQLEDVVAALNADFAGMNPNKSTIPSYFHDVDADHTCIQFCIGEINRIDGASCPAFGLMQDVELSACSHASSDDFLNIYSSDMNGQGLASCIPGFSGTCNDTQDGVYIDWAYFVIGTGATAPYDEGKTLTHEIGHWLGLRDISGDPGCNLDDGLADTPNQDDQNTGCPDNVNSCPGSMGTDLPDMFYNYMDNSDDACRTMFTQDQAAIMQATLASDRATLASSADRGNCDDTLRPACLTVNSSNTQTLNYTCNGYVDLLAIQQAWYGSSSDLNCYTWSTNGIGGTPVANPGAEYFAHSESNCYALESIVYTLTANCWSPDLDSDPNTIDPAFEGEIPAGTVTINLFPCQTCFGPESCQRYNSGIINFSPSGTTNTYTIPVPLGLGVISDIKILNINGTHPNVGELSMSLTSPQGTTVELMPRVCDNSSSFFLSFDDGASTSIQCPPTGVGPYTSLEALSAFDDENPAGDWTLSITDHGNTGNLQLTSWELEVCEVIPPVCEISNVELRADGACDGAYATYQVCFDVISGSGNYDILDLDNSDAVLASITGAAPITDPNVTGDEVCIAAQITAPTTASTLNIDVWDSDVNKCRGDVSLAVNIPTCTLPAVSILDPCTCLNNGTNTTIGSFDEVVMINSTATGEVWTVTSSSGAVGIANGTAFTDNGDDTYSLNFTHEDNIGYYMQIDGPLGQQFFATNICTYPDPTITLTNTYCNNDNTNYDLAAFVSEATGTPGAYFSYMVDGVPTSTFNPALLGTGTYAVSVQYDGFGPGGTGSPTGNASDAYTGTDGNVPQASNPMLSDCIDFAEAILVVEACCPASNGNTTLIINN